LKLGVDFKNTHFPASRLARGAWIETWRSSVNLEAFTDFCQKAWQASMDLVDEVWRKQQARQE
jgi:hypothetical protein